MSNLVMVVAMTLNLHEIEVHTNNIIENVYCCCDLDRGQADQVDVRWVVHQ